MAAITINDLRTNRDLDRQAMPTIRGAGGAPWVYEWIRHFIDVLPGVSAIINFYQINIRFYAEQVINQFQMVDLNNSAANSSINVVVDERSTKLRSDRLLA